MSSEVQDLTFTIMTKQPLEESRKLRSKIGRKHLFSRPHKKLKEDFVGNKWINGWYNEGSTVFQFQDAYKTVTFQCTPSTTHQFSYWPVFSHLSLVSFQGRGHIRAQERKCTGAPHWALAFSKANLELSPGGCILLPSCTSTSSLR